MKFTCLKENLGKSINIVHRVIPSKSTLDILKNILIEAENDTLTLSGTDQTTSIKTNVKASIDAPGKITVSAKKIKDLIDNISSRTLDIELKKDILHLISDTAKTKINGINAHDFPELPNMETNDIFIEVDPKTLNTALNYITFATGGPDSQPVLTGVLLSYADDLLTLVGCDGFRLAEKSIPISSHSESNTPFSIIVPARILSEICKIFGDDQLKIGVNTNENSIILSDSQTQATTVVISGQYPNYKAIIPQNTSTQIQVEADALLEAISLANVFNGDENKTVKIHFNPEGNVTITAKSSEDGTHESNLPAKITGSAMEIAFKSKYLLDYLNIHKGTTLTIDASSAAAPIKVTANNHDKYVYVVMPMQVR